jgi:hypothetical protein
VAASVTILPTGIGPNSPLVVYGDTSQDGTWYGGKPFQSSSNGIFGNKPMPHEDNLAVNLAVPGTQPQDNPPVQLATATDTDKTIIGTITRTDGNSWINAGFVVDGLVSINGTPVGNVKTLNAQTLTLMTLTPAFQTFANGTYTVTETNTGTISRTDGKSWLASDFVVEGIVTVGSLLSGITFARSSTGDTITRARGSWIADGFLAGQDITVRGTATNDLTYTLAAVTATTLTLTVSDTVTAEGPESVTISSDVGTINRITDIKKSVSVTFAQNAAGDTIKRASGSWIDDGFGAGHTIVVSGTAGNNRTFTIKSLTATTLTLTVSNSVTAEGPETATITDDTLNLFDLQPFFLTSQSGTHTIVQRNRLGNGEDHFIFPLAEEYQYAGNDFIDGHLLDAGVPNGQLPSIGYIAYGGAGNDTILGSQAGDILAGGSANNVIEGGRGQDEIFGADGINVNVITRVLTVATTAGKSGERDLDPINAGNNLIYGDAPGSTRNDAFGDYNKVIFGALGDITQEVSGARDTTKPLPALPQRIQTTLQARQVVSLARQNHGDNYIYGNSGESVLIGGGGNNAIDGGGSSTDGAHDRTLIFGANASLNRSAFAIVSATWSANTATITTNAANGFVTGQLVTIADVYPGSYNGTFAVTVISPTTFMYTLPLAANPGPGTTFGNATLLSSFANSRFEALNGTQIYSTSPSSVAKISAATWSNNIATITTMVAHGFYSGEFVTISGVTPSGYNGTYAVAVTSPTTFTFALLTNPGGPGSAFGAAAAGPDQDQVNGLPQLDPRGHAPWGNYQITLFDMGVTAPFNSFGNDYIAGGADDNTIFGEMGSDTIQGAGSIDYVSHLEESLAITSATWSNNTATITTNVPQGFVTGESVTISGLAPTIYNGTFVVTVTSPTTFTYSLPLATNPGPGTGTGLANGLEAMLLGGRVGVINVAPNVAGNPFRDANNALELRPSYSNTNTDGNDYIEGGGGNNIIFGNPQGQNDIIAGSSDQFGLTTRDLRNPAPSFLGPNADLGHNLIFGGSGTDIYRDDYGDTSPEGHAKNSDTIISNDGDIFRLVGVTVNGQVQLAPTVGIGSVGGVATFNGYLSFNYDSYSSVPISAATWSNGTAMITTSVPHGLVSGLSVTIAGVTPAGYNGTYIITVTSPTTFTFALAANPGPGTTFGTVTQVKIVARAARLLDYTPGGPAYAPTANQAAVTLPVTFVRQATGDTITRASGSWLTSGFVSGQIIMISGTVSNNGTFTIKSVTDLVLTLTVANTVTAEGPETATVSIYLDLGRLSEIHTENGDNFVFGDGGYNPIGQKGNIIYGGGQDNQIVGGYGNNWISGGAGNAAIIGTDGRIFTSRNGLAEPLNGVTAIPPNQLNMEIFTPGHIQDAIINVAGQLKSTVDLEPFSEDVTWNATTPIWNGGRTSPHQSDDIIFGGLGNTTIHGGSGDDAISGGEALPYSFVETTSGGFTPSGIAESDWYHPYNPHNPLLFNPDDPNRFKPGSPDPKPIVGRVGQFYLYDEFDPRRKILLNPDGTANKTGTGLPWFLDLDGGDRPGGVTTDGNKAIFGDLGNNWIVSGIGTNDAYGGFGNDLIDVRASQDIDGGLNDVPNTAANFTDRAYGGAGKDVLIADTSADRLIDWVGEFNSYIVPWAAFGMPQVSRTLQPQLPQFLYALSKSDGSDQTLAADYNSDPTRNGEPFGELGLVLQHDAAWHDQAGPPSDPQAGNNPGVKRVTIKAASFNGNQAPSMYVDSGSWSPSANYYQGTAATGGDAVSLFDFDQWLPSYYEFQATLKMTSGGTQQNAFLIFDYQSPTNFKYAGLDASNDLLRIGQRTSAGWIDSATLSYNAKINSQYNPFLAVNGTVATLTVGNATLSYTFRNSLNTGLLGIGVQSAVATFTWVQVQQLPHTFTYQITPTISNSGLQGFTVQSGQWSVASGATRYILTPPTGGPALSTRPLNVEASSYVEYQATVNAAANGNWAGLLFGYSGATDFLFAAVVPGSNQVILGHRNPSGWFTDAVSTQTISAGKDYTLLLALDSAPVGGGLPNVTVVLNGTSVLSLNYNIQFVGGVNQGDIQLGLLAQNGSASFYGLSIRGDDPAYAGGGSPQLAAAPAPVGAALPVPLTSEQLTATLAAARQRWLAMDPAPADAAALADVSIVIDKLPGLMIGQTIGHSIVIDPTAAGYGWFVDVTPLDDAEFSPRGGELVAGPSSPAFGKMDLETVVMHELGHVLGYGDLDAPAQANNLMATWLTPGVRRLPDSTALAVASTITTVTAVNPTAVPVTPPAAASPANPQIVSARPALTVTAGGVVAPSNWTLLALYQQRPALTPQLDAEFAAPARVDTPAVRDIAGSGLLIGPASSPMLSGTAIDGPGGDQPVLGRAVDTLLAALGEGELLASLGDASESSLAPGLTEEMAIEIAQFRQRHREG